MCEQGPLPNYRPEFDRIDLEFELSPVGEAAGTWWRTPCTPPPDFRSARAGPGPNMSRTAIGGGGDRRDEKPRSGWSGFSEEFIESENKRLKTAQDEQLPL